MYYYYCCKLLQIKISILLLMLLLALCCWAPGRENESVDHHIDTEIMFNITRILQKLPGNSPNECINASRNHQHGATTLKMEVWAYLERKMGCSMNMSD